MGLLTWPFDRPEPFGSSGGEGETHLAPWAKWLVRTSTNRVFYDIPTLVKAEQTARAEILNNPGKIVEIYKLFETAQNETTPVKFTKAENNND